MKKWTKNNTALSRLSPTGESVLGATLLLIVAWVMYDLVRFYPTEFHPRFWDEAVYLLSAKELGKQLSDPMVGLFYSQTKLGYGLALDLAVTVLGTGGAMILSTLMWVATIVVVFLGTKRGFGTLPGITVLALVASSPVFGKYVALDPALDWVTIDSRLILEPLGPMTADSLFLHQRTIVGLVADSLFSVSSPFYASDYFLAESAVHGIDVLREWRRRFSSRANRMTVFKIVER